MLQEPETPLAHRGTRELKTLGNSGGKVQLLGISKRGDTYVRTLLIHGTRSVLRHPDSAGAWVEQLGKRRPFNVVIVALANKIARTIWALLAHNRQYGRAYVSSKPF